MLVCLAHAKWKASATILAKQHFFNNSNVICLFQTYFELSHDPSNAVPGQAGFVPPLPTFQLDADANDNSLGSSESNSSESWHISPSKHDLLNEDNSSESTNIQRMHLRKASLICSAPLLCSSSIDVHLYSSFH